CGCAGVGALPFLLSKQAAAGNATGNGAALSSQAGKGMGIGEANAMREEKHHPSCLRPALQTDRPAALKLSSLLVFVCACVRVRLHRVTVRPSFPAAGVREVALFAPV
ncbi:hypothetical protein TraAM80_09537, partial [Trypanosoma rangeli]